MTVASPVGNDRIATGIDGLDILLYGGVPAGDQVIIAGGPGAGKTLLSLEILYNNAKKGGSGTFIALEEQESVVIQNFKRAFPSLSDIDDLVANNSLVVAGEEVTPKMEVGSDSESYSFGNVISSIESIIRSNNSKCVVIDSLSLIKLMFDNQALYRKYMLMLSLNLRKLGVNSFLTMELPHSDRGVLAFSPEFFIFDGTIVMYQGIEENKRTFSLEVIKMRGSNHSLSFSPYEITNKGFKVFSISEM